MSRGREQGIQTVARAGFSDSSWRRRRSSELGVFELRQTEEKMRHGAAKE